MSDSMETGAINDKSLMWDLRQYYAKVSGEALIDVAERMKANDFYNWFEALEDLRTLTMFKWTERTKTIPKYAELKAEAVRLSNLYPAVWTGASKEAKGNHLIMMALRAMTDHLMYCMDEGGLFGKQAFDDEGL